MKKIIISASYSGVNLGDETILQVIIENIKKINNNLQIVVLVWDRFLKFTPAFRQGSFIKGGEFTQNSYS